MNKQLSIYLYGIIIILAGLFQLFSKDSSFNSIRMTLGITFTVGAAFAFITAFMRKKRHVQFAYHELHAITMLVYGISILLICNTFKDLQLLTAFLLVFYSFSEIIFCIWLFDLKQKAIYKIIAVRFLLGLLIGIGTVVAINFTDITFEVFGLLFIMIGINIVLYAPIMKGQRDDV
jgi:uncharacterized membrane protein HdeD (DUF308 family)